MKILMMSRRIKNFLEKGGECKSCKLWWCWEEITCLSSSKRGRMWMYVYMILMMPKKNQTRLLQRISICFKINTRLLQQTKPCLKTKCFQDMQGSGNRLPGSVIDYQKGRMEKELLKRVLNLNFEHVIDYHMSVIDYQQLNSWNSNSKVMTLQIITV